MSTDWVRLAVAVKSLGHVRLFATPWTAACQTSLFFTISWNLLKLMSIELVMPSNHLFLCHSLLLLPSIFPSIRVFNNELTLHNRWSKYWCFSFSISPFKEYLELSWKSYQWEDEAVSMWLDCFSFFSLNYKSKVSFEIEGRSNIGSLRKWRNVSNSFGKSWEVKILNKCLPVSGENPREICVPKCERNPIVIICGFVKNP